MVTTFFRSDCLAIEVTQKEKDSKKGLHKQQENFMQNNERRKKTMLTYNYKIMKFFKIIL